MKSFSSHQPSFFPLDTTLNIGKLELEQIVTHVPVRWYMVYYAWCSCTQEAGAERWWVQGQLEQHSDKLSQNM